MVRIDPDDLSPVASGTRASLSFPVMLRGAPLSVLSLSRLSYNPVQGHIFAHGIGEELCEVPQGQPDQTPAFAWDPNPNVDELPRQDEFSAYIAQHLHVRHINRTS